MAKKNMKSVVNMLTPIAQALPTQNFQPVAAAELKALPLTEPDVQFSFNLRKSLRKELARLADDADVTMRSFILDALKEKGLKVTAADMADMRKKKPTNESG